MVTFAVNLGGHSYHALVTGVYAKLATFTALYINADCSNYFCHIYSIIRLIYSVRESCQFDIEYKI